MKKLILALFISTINAKCQNATVLFKAWKVSHVLKFVTLTNSKNKSKTRQKCEAPVINGELCTSKDDTFTNIITDRYRTFSDCPIINGDKCPAFPVFEDTDPFRQEQLRLCSIYIAEYVQQLDFDPDQNYVGFTFLTVKVGDEYFYNDKTFQTTTYDQNGRPLAHHAAINTGYTIMKESQLLDQMTRKSVRAHRNKQHYKILLEDFFGLSLGQMQQRQWHFFGFGFTYDSTRCDFRFDMMSVLGDELMGMDNMNGIEAARMEEKMENMMRFALNVARARNSRLVKFGELLELNYRNFVKWCPASRYKFVLTKLTQHEDKYELYKSNMKVTYYEFLKELSDNNAALSELFINTLRESRFAKFRFETPPISTDLKDSLSLEFILLDSPELQSTPDVEAFAEHFNNKNQPKGNRIELILFFSILIDYSNKPMNRTALHNIFEFVKNIDFDCANAT